MDDDNDLPNVHLLWVCQTTGCYNECNPPPFKHCDECRWAQMALFNSGEVAVRIPKSLGKPETRTAFGNAARHEIGPDLPMSDQAELSKQCDFEWHALVKRYGKLRSLTICQIIIKAFENEIGDLPTEGS